MENNFAPSQIIFAMINFLVLFLILRKKLFNPVSNFMKNRSEKIRNNIESAKVDKEEASKYKEESARELLKARVEGKNIVETYKKKAEKVYDEIVDHANEEAKSIKGRADIEIKREKDKAKQEVKEQAIDLSIILSEKVLERAIDEKEHRRLIDEFITKVGI
ncbi:F0F1 ATP synthase subunit B [Haloimpatiens sp. FM7315]|uniref:F0F1 ATP synthase subunit B n=1 Tax=Haloimpatiens sp. FM7315 TaxID=3298609 RepID=UPI0035A3A422